MNLEVDYKGEVMHI